MDIKKEFLKEGMIKHHAFTGISRFKEFLDNNEDFIVYFDPDIDGMISGLFVCRLLTGLRKNYQWYVNTARQHGFKLDLEKVRGKSLICVDFGITQSELDSISESVKGLISLDHHECGDVVIETENACVINNQYGFEEETSRYLSGAGVIFESIIALYPEFNTLENRALVGLTLLSDIRNIDNINARLYLQDLYEHPYRGYIKYLISGTISSIDYTFGLPRLDRNYVDFTFSPAINASLRFNKEKDVVNFFLGQGNINKKYHKLQQKLVEDLLSSSGITELSSTIMVCIDGNRYKGTDVEPFLSNFVGLLASRFLDGYRSVFAYLIIDGELIRASFRGRFNGVDYLSKLSNELEGAGHGSAFGIMNMGLTDEHFEKYNAICEEVELGIEKVNDYIKVNNLSVFVSNNQAYKIGVNNIFTLTENKKFLQYQGNNIKTKRNNSKVIEYLIDGVSVLCFNLDLNPQKDLIMPTIDRGVLRFYLNESLE
jgi:single-stranded DNA-specific DHH superfamily exonuclease